MHKSVIIAVLAALLALGIVNVSIFKKEALLKDGDIIFLELAPVDPRSLMQGDYMALRFKVGNDIRIQLKQEQSGGTSLKSQDGKVVVTVAGNAVGHFARINGRDRKKLAENERLIKFRVRNEKVKFATNAFFFQEGTAHIYEQARYGEFRVDADGDILLTGLRSESLEKL